MKSAICFAAAIVFGLVGTAAADIQEFHVEVNPALGTMRYEVPGIYGSSLGCGPDPVVCDFGLELDMRLQLDGLGKAQATFEYLRLHGSYGAVGDHSLANALRYLQLIDQVTDQLTAAEFIVDAGAEPGQTRFTASYPMGDDLVLEFDRAKLMTMSGGPDFRPADGPKYTFSYTVPEPSTFALALIAALGCGWRCIARRCGTR